MLMAAGMDAQDMENKLLADVGEAKKALLDEVDSAKKEELRMMWKEAKDELNSFRRQQVAGGETCSVHPTRAAPLSSRVSSLFSQPCLQ